MKREVDKRGKRKPRGKKQSHKPKFERWSAHESSRLKAAVARHAGKDWKTIAEEVGTKGKYSCYQHWHRVVNPKLKKDDFSFEELHTLAQSVGIHGLHHWTRVASMLPHRSDTHCRSKWMAIKSGDSEMDKRLQRIAHEGPGYSTLSTSSMTSDVKKISKSDYVTSVVQQPMSSELWLHEKAPVGQFQSSSLSPSPSPFQSSCAITFPLRFCHGKETWNLPPWKKMEERTDRGPFDP
eukprot:TRINITY_DN212_c0_g1_i1.p1 TRINITY_DN212_c0_g1~~TRINITY_DN212_c0_g1_i1.p1  ORF type:complete len:237 (+),score=54.24 TRINITY_DN212_c0_g1_i1:178-888(+)